MSVGFGVVSWTPHKKRYDAMLALFIGVHVLTTSLFYSGDLAISSEVILIRALGACAITLLHIALAIGPLHRLWPRTAPLLFNRRHLGVLTFLVALAHGVLSLGYYHGFGIMNPLRSLLVNTTNYSSVRGFPFEILGVLALFVLFALAATSHDVWLKVLTPRVWKRIHLLIYPAYLLLVGHVALGGLQVRSGWLAPGLLILGAIALAVLHLAAALADGRRRRANALKLPADAPWLSVGTIDSIPFDRARTVISPTGTRIAVFRSADGITAIDNRCAHQGGPLGEGRVIDGCITCPWHGWQYRALDGCAPPPFSERLPTYQVRIVNEVVQVSSLAYAPGNAPPPAIPGGPAQARSTSAQPDFYVNYLPMSPNLRRVTVFAAGAALWVLVAVAAIAALTQRSPGPAVWDDAHLREFSGWLVALPAPALLTSDPATGQQHAILLVELGKHGASDRLAPLIGSFVTASGWVLRRDERTMLELDPAALPIVTQAPASNPSASLATTDLGTVSLEGEIVDAKCFWGAMKPGDGKTHKACATLCIRGGIPPVLVVSGPGERTQQFLLRCPGATSMPSSLEFLIADPVQVTGTHLRLGDLSILEVSADSVRPLQTPQRD